MIFRVPLLRPYCVFWVSRIDRTKQAYAFRHLFATVAVFALAAFSGAPAVSCQTRSGFAIKRVEKNLASSQKSWGSNPQSGTETVTSKPTYCCIRGLLANGA
jgi:hypothetical protein